jgi:hypothetical protein
MISAVHSDYEERESQKTVEEAPGQGHPPLLRVHGLRAGRLSCFKPRPGGQAFASVC